MIVEPLYKHAHEHTSTLHTMPNKQTKKNRYKETENMLKTQQDKKSD